MLVTHTQCIVDKISTLMMFGLKLIPQRKTSQKGALKPQNPHL